MDRVLCPTRMQLRQRRRHCPIQKIPMVRGDLLPPHPETHVDDHAPASFRCHAHPLHHYWLRLAHLLQVTGFSLERTSVRNVSQVLLRYHTRNLIWRGRDSFLRGPEHRQYLRRYPVSLPEQVCARRCPSLRRRPEIHGLRPQQHSRRIQVGQLEEVNAPICIRPAAELVGEARSGKENMPPTPRMRQRMVRPGIAGTREVF
jgi:hypothetical protein